MSVYETLAQAICDGNTELFKVYEPEGANSKRLALDREDVKHVIYLLFRYIVSTNSYSDIHRARESRVEEFCKACLDVNYGGDIHYIHGYCIAILSYISTWGSKNGPGNHQVDFVNRILKPEFSMLSETDAHRLSWIWAESLKYFQLELREAQRMLRNAKKEE